MNTDTLTLDCFYPQYFILNEESADCRPLVLTDKNTKEEQSRIEIFSFRLHAAFPHDIHNAM